MKAHEWLREPERWTQGAMARTQNYNEQCSPENSRAMSFCLLGAITKCYGRGNRGAIMDRLQLKIGNIVEWNDSPTRTHAEVLALLIEEDV